MNITEQLRFLAADLFLEFLTGSFLTEDMKAKRRVSLDLHAGCVVTFPFLESFWFEFVRLKGSNWLASGFDIVGGDFYAARNCLGNGSLSLSFSLSQLNMSPTFFFDTFYIRRMDASG